MIDLYCQKFIDFLLPPTCPICHHRVSQNHTLCAECFEKLSFLSKNVCSKCGRPITYGTVCACCLKKVPVVHSVRSVLKYNQASKNLILPFKHADHIELAYLFTQWMNLYDKEQIAGCDCIVPVPLHLTRLFKRKYNQSALIAQKLSKLNHKEYLPQILYRNRMTKSQGHFTHQQRKRNVAKAFSVSHSTKIQGKKILLIDDVYTTGATVNECAKILIKNGAKQVDVLTVARVLKD